MDKSDKADKRNYKHIQFIKISIKFINKILANTNL